MLLLLTVTKDRPAAFAQLARLVEKQTAEEWDWLVVSDGSEGYKFPKKCTVVRRDPSEDTLPSICSNWLAALDWVEAHPKYDKIVVLEDDDYYHQDYVRETRKWLEKTELMGWFDDAYYFVMSRKALRRHNIGFAALAATAFTRSVLPWVRECCSQGEWWIDMLLWKGIREQVQIRQPPMVLPDGSTREVAPVPVSRVIKEWTGSKLLVHNFYGIQDGSREQPQIDRKTGDVVNEHPRHIGMKQNWHGGLGETSSRGHDPTQGGAIDTLGKVLRKWIGDDAGFYLKCTEDRVPARPVAAGGKASYYQPGVLHHDLPLE